MTRAPILGSPVPRSVVDRLGVRLRAVGPGPDPAVLLGLALRRNPRRAQLLVSRVLGKHIPTDPRLVRAAGLLLGGLVADALAGREPRALPVELLHAAVRRMPGAAAGLHASALHDATRRAPARRHADAGLPPDAAAGPLVDALVLGFAETATALGHCVAEGLGGADYLHSTRRPVPGIAVAGGFTEEHSHATDHLLLPADPALLRDGRPLVLVDDELSTGRTVLNTITALHRQAPRAHYVVATLVDVRPSASHPSERTALSSTPTGPECRSFGPGLAALGARVDVVSLARASIVLPADVAERADAIRAGLDAPTGPSGRSGTHLVQGPARGPGVPAVRVELAGLGWPVGLPTGGRHGFSTDHHRALDAALPGIAAALARAAHLHEGGERVLVLGTEELMALPLRLAQVLADAGHDVAFSTTTRSPAVVVDEPGYALTSGLVFAAHDDPADGAGPRYAYNLGRATDPPWDNVLVVVDPPADTLALHTGLLPALAPHTRRTTLVVTPS